MQYAELITNAAYRSTGDDVQQLRDHGWTENQISEAVYIIAMFALLQPASPMRLAFRPRIIFSLGKRRLSSSTTRAPCLNSVFGLLRLPYQVDRVVAGERSLAARTIAYLVLGLGKKTFVVPNFLRAAVCRIEGVARLCAAAVRASAMSY